jgi:hypothetical protein
MHGAKVKMYIVLYVKQWNFNFLHRLEKNHEISNFMKIRPVGTELFHADGRTDRHYEANSRFLQFCERT